MPGILQTRAKIRWDDDFLFVGAELREQYVSAKIRGHNGPKPPYKDNDFEVFVDVSGTTQYYKEFEMSALNATYDVLWGVPDGDDLACAKQPPSYLLVCVNTSFPGYVGNWTMFNEVVPGLQGGGLTTAVQASSWERYTYPYSVWQVEIAFPLRSGSSGGGEGWHGGLLDAGALDYARYDPQHGPQQLYWQFDLSRAEHARKYMPGRPGQNFTFCPFGCVSGLNDTASEMVVQTEDCSIVRNRWPTFLGSDPWNCYWEWAYSDVGRSSYMHRPMYWAILEFSGPEDIRMCRQVEWPGRYLARMVFTSQRSFLKEKGTYAEHIGQLIPKCDETPGCDQNDLAYAVERRDVFSFKIDVQRNASLLSAQCTARPCFTAIIVAHIPLHNKEPYVYKTSIDTNSKLETAHSLPRGQRPCL